MKRPEKLKRNATPQDVEDKVDEQDKYIDSMLNHRAVSWLLLGLLLVVGGVLTWKLNYPNDGDKITKVERERDSFKTEIDVVKVKLSDADKVKEKLDGELTEAKKAKDAAEKAKSDAELASRAANTQLDDVRKSIPSEVSKQLAEEKKKFDAEFVATKEKLAEVIGSKGELQKKYDECLVVGEKEISRLERKLEEKEKELLAAKSAQSAPVVVHTPAPTSSSATVVQNVDPANPLANAKVILLASSQPNSDITVGSVTQRNFFEIELRKMEADAAANPAEAFQIRKFISAVRALSNGDHLTPEQRKLIDKIIIVKKNRNTEGGRKDAEEFGKALARAK